MPIWWYLACASHCGVLCSGSCHVVVMSGCVLLLTASAGHRCGGMALRSFLERVTSLLVTLLLLTLHVQAHVAE